MRSKPIQPCPQLDVVKNDRPRSIQFRLVNFDTRGGLGSDPAGPVCTNIVDTSVIDPFHISELTLLRQVLGWPVSRRPLRVSRDASPECHLPQQDKCTVIRRPATDGKDNAVPHPQVGLSSHHRGGAHRRRRLRRSGDIRTPAGPTRLLARCTTGQFGSSDG